MKWERLVWTAALAGAGLALSLAAAPPEKDDGYRGIWYYNQPSKDRYVYKYSGGFATYPQQHAPIAVYSKEAHKTFFCYGGTTKGKHNQLLHMVSYFDHQTGMVPRPTILLDKQTEDAHDNPTIALDREGCLWIFSAAHGTSRPAFIHRSRQPYSINDFELISRTNFSYPQAWHLPEFGFVFLHTRYGQPPGSQSSGRALHLMTSADGRAWSEPQLAAFAGLGHYQISWPQGNRLGTAFDFHPPPVGLNERTNFYYMETRDGGRTWTTAGGARVELPLKEERNVALVRDYRSEKQLVYLKDLQYDAQGRPVVVYLTSQSYNSGPQSPPRRFWLARFNGRDWTYLPMMETDHNYDHGSLWLEPGRWRFLAPTGPGAQAYGTGGAMEVWESRDEGRTWKRLRTLMRDSRLNHTYARRPLNAHPGFAMLWADGDAFAPSGSSLYFTNREMKRVWRLPKTMTAEFARPEPVQP